eukprot:TRINITY_DN36490_c0_g1_i1.p1 TRINITY_DN36490_c0_g1~~TRINITY_DN36490_c0_g1_i1.p1  ORF type:complete len:737 (-),score=122.82 TRINITY_DN36490_c0_g1_i1:47-2257(-)
MPATPGLAGYLFLKNASGIGWGQFWFHLDEDTLTWRVDKGDDFIIGTIVLEDVHEFISIEGPLGSEKVFSLDSNNRLYSFKATSDDMHHVWCDAIVRRLPKECGTNGYTVEAVPHPPLTLLKLVLSRPDPVALHQLFIESDYIRQEDLPAMLTSQLNTKLMANELHHLTKEVGVRLEGGDEDTIYFEANSFCEVILWLERACELVLTLSDIPYEKDTEDWLAHVPMQEIWQRLCRVSVVPVLRLVAQLSAETADAMHEVVSKWARPVVTPKTFAELLEKMDIAIQSEQVPVFVEFLGLSREKEFTVDVIIQTFAHLQRAFRLLFTLTLCVAQSQSHKVDDTIDTTASFNFDETFGTVSSGEFNTDAFGDNSLPSWPSTMQQSIPIESDPSRHHHHHFDPNSDDYDSRDEGVMRYVPPAPVGVAVTSAKGPQQQQQQKQSEQAKSSHPAPEYQKPKPPPLQDGAGNGVHTNGHDNNVVRAAADAGGAAAAAATGDDGGAGRKGPWGGRVHNLKHRDRRNTEPVGRSSNTSSSEDFHELKEGFHLPGDSPKKSDSSPQRAPANSIACDHVYGNGAAGTMARQGSGSQLEGRGHHSNGIGSGKANGTAGVSSAAVPSPRAKKKKLQRQETDPGRRRRSTSAFNDMVGKGDDRALSDYVSVLEEQLADEREARQRIEIAYIELENELHVKQVQNERRTSRAGGAGAMPRSDLSQLSIQGSEQQPLLRKVENQCFRLCAIM